MEDMSLKTREDFLWGICIHTPGFGGAYKESNLEQLVFSAAKMGCGLIRIDTDGTTLAHIDNVVRLANAYKMKVMLILGILGFERRIKERVDYTAPLTEKFRLYAERYNGENGCGRIDFIQIHNEMDNYINFATDFCGRPIPDGDKVEHWNKEYLYNVSIQVKAAIDGVRQSNTGIKTVINISWKHYGMLEYFKSVGIDWDITGSDWYEDMMTKIVESEGLTPYAIGKTLYDKFRKPIIICESNVWKNEAFDENDMKNYENLMSCMQDAYSCNYVIGYTFYELCDEPGREKNEKWDREAHFGMLACSRNGDITGEKPIYYRIKEFISSDQSPDIIDWNKIKSKERCDLHIPL